MQRVGFNYFWRADHPTHGVPHFVEKGHIEIGVWSFAYWEIVFFGESGINKSFDLFSECIINSKIIPVLFMNNYFNMWTQPIRFPIVGFVVHRDNHYWKDLTIITSKTYLKQDTVSPNWHLKIIGLPRLELLYLSYLARNG